MDQRAVNLRRAADYLGFRSADGLALAADAIERAGCSLPLRDLLEQRWRALMQDKANRELSGQVDALRTECITTLRKMADDIEQGIEPEDP